MNDHFQILFELLESDLPEVSGRVAAPITSELRQRMARFAAGESAEDERTEIKKMLLEKPELTSVLANEVRALRQPDQ